jgi:hypothetical protein
MKAAAAFIEKFTAILRHAVSKNREHPGQEPPEWRGMERLLPRAPGQASSDWCRRQQMPPKR